MKKTKSLLIALLISAAFDVALAEIEFHEYCEQLGWPAQKCAESKARHEQWTAEYYASGRAAEVRRMIEAASIESLPVSECKHEFKQKFEVVLGFYPTKFLINKDEKDQCVSWSSTSGAACSNYGELSGILKPHWSVRPWCDFQEDLQKIYDQYGQDSDYGPAGMPRGMRKERADKIRQAERFYGIEVQFGVEQNKNEKLF
ncbi:TPA: hypothetical protein ACXJTR_003657 [Pseudomonas aeruginosa]